LPARARPRFLSQLIGEDLAADVERFQCASGRGFTQGVQAEHEVFGPDVLIVSRPRFGLGLLQQANRSRSERIGDVGLRCDVALGSGSLPAVETYAQL
jgi:hypothetical protein